MTQQIGKKGGETGEGERGYLYLKSSPISRDEMKGARFSPFLTYSTVSNLVDLPDVLSRAHTPWLSCGVDIHALVAYCW